ncbi:MULTISPECIES: hypothetical protein [unclassified Cryobacterium]|uniref:hypothetical protein n=1 Tax=unclassified Cryobacterium TaxID=2649013 RepID=UPI002AB5B710|nr:MULTISPECIES: hypothetical protein [unclassified Cryobacterium]MDY7542611.1 hypothetical protein [Cryobacterium sp. 5B3]MEB0264731.1 hypothetical protein [Cryobacterium sp. 10I5]MEB0273703.1 hypothetical protein [Cryobacterium sp. 5B3]
MPEPIEPVVEPVTPPVEPVEVPKPTPPVEPVTPPVETFDAAYVKKLREENAAARVKGKEDAEAAAKTASEAAYKELGQKLGLVAAEDETTVESLSAAIQEKDSTITTQSADIKAARLDNALLKVVGKHGADYDLLTDSASFQAKLAAIDTTDPEYRSLVDDLVKTSVTSNPKLRAVQVAPRSGGEAPPAGSTAPDGPKSIDDLRKERQARRAN